MDYRKLLVKYIRHVSNSEGVSFLEGYRNMDLFTQEEWDELVKLDNIFIEPLDEKKWGDHE